MYFSHFKYQLIELLPLWFSVQFAVFFDWGRGRVVFFDSELLRWVLKTAFWSFYIYMCLVAVCVDLSTIYDGLY